MGRRCASPHTPCVLGAENMKNRMREILLYPLWAIALPNHADAGQEIFDLFSRPNKSIVVVVFFASWAILVFAVSPVIGGVRRENWIKTSVVALLTWLVSFVVFWVVATKFVTQWVPALNSVENMWTLVIFFVLPHILIPLPPFIWFVRHKRNCAEQGSKMGSSLLLTHGR